MSIDRMLLDRAAELAQRSQRGAAKLQGELLDIEERKREIEAELHTAHRASQRLARFPATRDGDLPCPDCWMGEGVVRYLDAQDSPSERFDDYWCPACNFTLRVPI